MREIGWSKRPIKQSGTHITYDALLEWEKEPVPKGKPVRKE